MGSHYAGVVIVTAKKELTLQQALFPHHTAIFLSFDSDDCKDVADLALLGPFGPPCALREHGLRLTGTGSAREKKRAVVAVARKLAVLLLSLWKHDKDYEPRASVAPALVLTPSAT